MATNFPNSLDSLTNPATTDQLSSPSHAAQHANANDAIEQLQAKVGVNSSTVTTSHDYKIAQLEAAITAGVSGTKLIYQDVRNQSGASLTKGTPVRVTGSDGASGKLLIASATNATESGSSKTFGLVSSTISNNSNGQVVTNGLLENVDTTGAVDGDPVWLGVNGAKIFGLVNKPSAPAHLVYLGVVVRGGQQNTGSIFVSIQNGFELHELHNVAINQVQNKNALVYDSTTELWKNYDLSNDFVLAGDLQNSLGDYIPLNVLGQPSGPAALDADGNLIVPENKIIIEGATADANELTIQAPDVTSDITVTLPNATGTLALTSDITTAVNNLVNSAPNTLDTLNELATALGNDANFATTTATSIGNKVSKAGGDVITPSSASVKGLVIRAATSQTANLQQWETGAGTVAALVDGNGQFETGYFYTNFGGGSYKNSGLITINPANNIVPLVIAGVSGQTSDLQQWKNSAGTVLAKVDASGIGTFAQGSFAGGAATIDGGGGASLGAIYTGTLKGSPTAYNFFSNVTGSPYATVVVKSLSGQTTNLQEWQNSAGTVLASVDAYGTLLSNWKAYIQSGASYLTPMTIVGASGQSANLQEWKNSAGTVLTGVSPIGQSFFQNTTPITASAVSQAITAVSFTSTTATYTFSATVQTISVGEYVTVFGITPSGYNGTYQVTAVATVSAGSSYSFTVANTTNATVTVGTGYFFPSASVSISTQNKAHTGLIVKAVSGQTASTMEIQNSLGQPVTWWDSSGGMTASQAVVSTLYSGGFMNTGTRGYFNATTFSPSVSPIVVRGVTSQTADLQQWQDSAGNVLSRISPNGLVNTSAILSKNNYSSYFSFADNQPIFANPLTAAHVALVVKAAASQTANLQEWHNSAGTVLASINQYGGASFVQGGVAITGGSSLLVTNDIYSVYGKIVTGYGVNSPLGQFTSVASTSSTIPIVVRGATSQTANLQEWQNSAGTVLASLSSSGNLMVQDLTVNGTTTTINSTTLTVDDKNIELASVTSPTDTTADGAGITIKGATDKTFNWVQSTAAFTSSEPISAPAFKSAGTAVSSNITLLSGYRYFVDTTSARTLTLPASPSLGDEIAIFDASGLAFTNNITISRNGNKINGVSDNGIIDINGAKSTLTYTGSTYGWRFE